MKAFPITKLLYILLLSSITANTQSWEFVGLDSMVIKQLYFCNDSIYAGCAVRNGANITSGLYFSANGGINWVQLDSALGRGSIVGLEYRGEGIFFLIKGLSEGSLAGKLYKTTNRGSNWQIVSGLEDRSIKWFAISHFSNNEMYALDNGYVKFLYRSTDSGKNWEQIGLFPSSSHGNRVTVALDQINGSKLYAAVDDRIGGNYFYISTNKGDTWDYISEPPTVQQELISDPTIPNKVFMMPGYYLTEDNGYSWLIADSCFPNNYSYLSFYVDPFNKTNSYSLRLDGLYKTKNDTICWQLIEGSDNLLLNLGGEGFQYYDIGQLRNVFIDTIKNEIYVGTSMGIYKRDLITDVKQDENTQPTEFILFQNYPNPFNSSTLISFQLKAAGLTTLDVYDILGKEVITLVNEEKQEGKYSVEFNENKLTSGVYFYVLTVTTENGKRYKQGRKMLMLK